MRAFVFALLAALSIHAKADEPTIHAIAGSAVDCLSTGFGLSFAPAGGAAITEANPIGPIAACAVKAVVIVSAQKRDEPAKTFTLNGIEATSWGAGANNLAVTLAHALNIAAGPVPVVIGALVGWYVWHRSADEREFAKLCAVQRKLAGDQAMTCVFKPH